jgi:hypothetical protein
MAAPHHDVTKLLAKTKLVVMPEDYFLVRLPVDAKPIPGEWYRPATTRFAVFIREPNEITLVVPRRKWLRMQNIFEKYEVSGPMKVITFDIKLSLSVFGYIAAVSRALAEAKVSVLPMSSFHRDHILVSKKDLPRSMRLLRQLVQECKTRNAKVRSSGGK